MVQVKDLTELKVEDLWREVKGDEEEWWGDLKQETLRVVKSLTGLGGNLQSSPKKSSRVYAIKHW